MLEFNFCFIFNLSVQVVHHIPKGERSWFKKKLNQGRCKKLRFTGHINLHHSPATLSDI